MRCLTAACVSLSVVSFLGVTARADFSGQPLLGPLTPGLSVAGDLRGKSDDNDGFFSGMHIFDIWDGGDDVYTVNWAGGNLKVDLTSDIDADLFLYRPSDLDESSDYSAAGTFDSVTITGAAAGTYYIVVDTTAGSESPYTILVHPVPAPGAAGLLLATGLLAGRRRR